VVKAKRQTPIRAFRSVNVAIETRPVIVVGPI
jgi:hypothetical protein